MYGSRVELDTDLLARLVVLVLPVLAQCLIELIQGTYGLQVRGYLYPSSNAMNRLGDYTWIIHVNVPPT
jgi:hypothetical protein